MNSSPRPVGSSSADDRETLREETITPGAGSEDIPAIDRPEFVEPRAAPEFLEDGDVVFGLVHDVVAGDPISVTYCPLTGTAMGFDPGKTDGIGVIRTAVHHFRIDPTQPCGRTGTQ